jgi:spore coat protein U-like protein
LLINTFERSSAFETQKLALTFMKMRLGYTHPAIRTGKFPMNIQSKHVRTLIVASVAFACVALLNLPASAATATTTFGITSTVQSNCVMSGNSLGFGAYTGSAIPVTTTLSVTCTNGTTYNVGLNAGTASGATVTNRGMTGPGGAWLGYALYQDSSRTTNWGQTVGTDTVGGTGNGSAQSITVYGQLAASQFVTPGSYSDTITATITY